MDDFGDGYPDDIDPDRVDEPDQDHDPDEEEDEPDVVDDDHETGAEHSDIDRNDADPGWPTSEPADLTEPDAFPQHDAPTEQLPHPGSTEPGQLNAADHHVGAPGQLGRPGDPPIPYGANPADRVQQQSVEDDRRRPPDPGANEITQPIPVVPPLPPTVPTHPGPQAPGTGAMPHHDRQRAHGGPQHDRRGR